MELESGKVKKGQITDADLQHAEAIFGRVIDDQKKIGYRVYIHFISFSLFYSSISMNDYILLLGSHARYETF